MALYPNGRYLSRVAGRHFGGATAAVGGSGAGFDTVQRGLRGARLNRFAGEEHLANASTPDGYGMQALVPPLTAGSMSALVRSIEITGSGNLLQGGPMEGSASIALTVPDASLSMIVSMDGTGAFAITPSAAVLSMVVGMDGAGSISLTGSGALSMIVPFDGTGSFSLTGSGDLKGRLSMDGSWTPFTELSPESLAASVWSYVTRTLTAGGGGGGGLTTDQANQLLELHRIHGLELGSPLIVSSASRSAGGINQSIVEGGGMTTVTRTP